MTVVINELPGSPKGQYTESGVYVFTRMVRTTWADIDAYAQQLQPATTVVGNQIVHYPGEAFPGFPNFRVKSFEFEPYFGTQDLITNQVDDSTTDPPDYNHAKWTIQYAIPTSPQSSAEADDPRNRDPVPFLEHSITSGGQFLTLGEKDSASVPWNWLNEDGNFIEAVEADVERIAGIIGTTQHVVAWPRIPQPNWLALERYKAHVNLYPFTLRGHEYPAEALLYMGYDARETVMTDGEKAFNLTIKFEGKQVSNVGFTAPSTGAYASVPLDDYGGHNHYFNRSVKAWVRVSTDTSLLRTEPDLAKCPYKAADFNELFQAGA